MLKRIAVLDGNEELFEAAKKAADKEEVQVVKMEPGDDVPVATSAFMGGNSADAGLKAALALSNQQEKILNLLAEAIDCREGLMPGTSKRLQEHATRFAKALNLSIDDQLALERAALIRDIGKLRIPNDPLLKDGVLNYDEWMKLQCHPKYGHEIVQEYDVFKDTEEIVCCHHECYDGDGYPRGIEGDAIPHLARVMKILDVYCAMTSPRHYRKGYASHETAVEYLRSEQGKHFDPDLIDVFIDNNIGQTDPPPEEED